MKNTSEAVSERVNITANNNDIGAKLRLWLSKNIALLIFLGSLGALFTWTNISSRHESAAFNRSMTAPRSTEAGRFALQGYNACRRYMAERSGVSQPTKTTCMARVVDDARSQIGEQFSHDVTLVFEQPVFSKFPFVE